MFLVCHNLYISCVSQPRQSSRCAVDREQASTHSIARATCYHDLIISPKLVPRCFLCDLLQQVEPLLRLYSWILNISDEGLQLLLKGTKRSCKSAQLRNYRRLPVDEQA